MEFKLFGRLRDDEEGTDSGDSGLSGGSLERTVENLFQQGYSEEEIRKELKGRYDSSEITDAVSDVVKSSATEIGEERPQAMTQFSENSDDAVSPMDEGFAEGTDSGGERQDNFQNFEAQSEDMAQERGPSNRQIGQAAPRGPRDSEIDPVIEETIETVVAEEFSRVKNEFKSVYEQIDMLADELEGLEKQLKEVQESDDSGKDETEKRINDLEDDLNTYNSRIKGLEKAFKQVLPALVDNVKELTSLVQEIKQEKGIETSTEVSKDDVEDIDMSDW